VGTVFQAGAHGDLSTVGRWEVLSGGVPVDEVAKRYGVSRKTVHAWVQSAQLAIKVEAAQL
jgi:transposase